MISEITFNGYRFFADGSSLSFVADRRVKSLLSNSFSLDKRQILKSLALYGGNNTGKTNIVALMVAIKRVLQGQDRIKFNSDVFNDRRGVSISITYNNQDDLKWLRYEFEYDCVKREFLKERIEAITYYESGNPNIKTVLELDRDAKILNVFGINKTELLDVIVGQKPFVYSVKVDEGSFANLGPYKGSFVKLAESIEIVDLYNVPIDKTIEALKGHRFLCQTRRLVHRLVRTEDE